MAFFEGNSTNSTLASGAPTIAPERNTAAYREAFEAEALPHFDLVHRAARRVARDGSWAKDLAQDVFLQAWKSFNRFEPGTNCKAWLMAILFHICQHHRRRAWRSQSVSWRPEHDTLVAYHPREPSHSSDGAL